MVISFTKIYWYLGCIFQQQPRIVKLNVQQKLFIKCTTKANILKLPKSKNIHTKIKPPTRKTKFYQLKYNLGEKLFAKNIFELVSLQNSKKIIFKQSISTYVFPNFTHNVV